MEMMGGLAKRMAGTRRSVPVQQRHWRHYKSVAGTAHLKALRVAVQPLQRRAAHVGEASGALLQQQVAGSKRG